MAHGWREHDSFETRTARVGGELSDMMEHARKAGATEEESALLMHAAQGMTDAMRQVRRAIHDRIIAAGGRR